MATTPPLTDGRQVLLFIRDAQLDASRAAVASVRRMLWPDGLEPRIEDVLVSDELARWYGVVKFPAVAIVDDGMLVAIEHECTAAACERLLALASVRTSALNSFVL